MSTLATGGTTMGKISTPSLDMNLLLLADRTGYRSNSPACHKIELEKSFFFFFWRTELPSMHNGHSAGACTTTSGHMKLERWNG